MLRGVYARAVELVAKPKREYVRSRTLLDNVRYIPFCTACFTWAPVVAAHSNWSCHGKGGHIKADDNRIAALCTTCHRDCDQGSDMDERERQQMWWKAHCITVKTLRHKKLWPADVPVPDTRDDPISMTVRKQLAVETVSFPPVEIVRQRAVALLADGELGIATDADTYANTKKQARCRAHRHRQADIQHRPWRSTRANTMLSRLPNWPGLLSRRAKPHGKGFCPVDKRHVTI